MNRPIKFKAKSIEDESWVYGFVKYALSGRAYIGTPEDGGRWDSCQVDPETVCQLMFIHKDVEIYEGDKLLDNLGDVLIVKYNKNIPSYLDETPRGRLSEITKNFFNDRWAYEVIGNIHDK